MTVGPNIKEAIRSLLSAKQRTILALIGIVIGIGSVIAMVSIGKIVQEESLRQFKEMGTDIITVDKDSGDVMPPTGESKAALDQISLSDAQAIPATCPAVSVVAPFVRGSGEAAYAGKKIQGFSVMGVTGSFLDLNKLKVIRGRFISDLDDQNRYCVISSNMQSEMRKLGAVPIIGEKLKVGEQFFTIVGVIEHVPEGGMRRFDPNSVVYLHITTAIRSYKKAEISSILCRVRAGITNQVAGNQVTDYFRTRPRPVNIKVISPEEIIAQMEKQMQMFTLLLGAIGSISLIVGGVGVMNVMLVSVTERRREIGIRRALGAKRRDIREQFLIESIILSLIGGVLGILFGVGASRIISHFAHWQFILSFSAILLGVGVSNAVGIFFGYYPARQASLLDPIVALKSD